MIFFSQIKPSAEVNMKNFNLSKKKLCWSLVFSASLACLAQSAHSEGVGGEGTGGTMEDGQPIKKSPTFQEADKNGDHYVTKDELKDDPFLLKHFDMVDAGKDGKLEEHEYENLIMEKRREKGQ
jgi:hypothetical protein